MNKTTHLDKAGIVALRGIRLPSVALKLLQRSGIYCEPAVGVEYQRAANTYVLRAVESGGAVAQFGCYAACTNMDGSPLSWLQRIDSVACNGLHALVVGREFVRLQMFRVGFTYELLITEHRLEYGMRKRPSLRSRGLTHARHGTLQLELWGKDSGFSGHVAPVFHTRSGERLLTPEAFDQAVRQLTSAVCCIGCRHCHLLEPPAIETTGVGK